MTASLLVCSGLAGGLLAPAPAGSAENVRHTVWLSESGFSQRLLKATQGDLITFQLDQNARTPHTVTWDKGAVEVELSRDNPSATFSMETVGPHYFWDRHHIRDKNADAFIGLVEVAAAPKPPPSSSTTTSSTTTTTAPTTTTSTMPTTTTTARPIQPQAIPDPPETTTTTAAPTPPPSMGNEPPPAPPSTVDNDKPKDKAGKYEDKTKDDKAPDTTATTDPALSDVPIELFDAAVLTPGPSIVPEPADAGGEDEAAINAARVASLLDAPKADDHDNGVLVLLSLAGVGALLVLVIGWAWFTRSSRYDPA